VGLGLFFALQGLVEAPASPIRRVIWNYSFQSITYINSSSLQLQAKHIYIVEEEERIIVALFLKRKMEIKVMFFPNWLSMNIWDLIYVVLHSFIYSFFQMNLMGLKCVTSIFYAQFLYYWQHVSNIGWSLISLLIFLLHAGVLAGW